MVIVGLFFAIMSAATPTLNNTEGGFWQLLRNEVADIIMDKAPCGPASYHVGFCATESSPDPTPEEAKLATGCRGQPRKYLQELGSAFSNEGSREKAVEFLSDFFEARRREIAFGARASLAERIHGARILDQAIIRLKMPEENLGTDTRAAYGIKWLFECAHRRYAAGLVREFIARNSPDDLAEDPGLAEDVWLIIQHATMYPDLQKRAIEYFKSHDSESFNRFIAYLTDRYRRNRGFKQQYATQLGCRDGQLHVAPMEPHDAVNGRRKSLGLMPLDQHLTDWKQRCRERAKKH